MSLEHITSVSSQGVASFDLTNIFNDKFSVYRIDLWNADISNADYTYFRIINSSETDSDSNYDMANYFMYSHTTDAPSYSENITTANYLGYQYPAGYDDGMGATMYVFNAADAATYTAFTAQTVSFANGVGMYNSNSIFMHKVAEAVTGLSFQRTGTWNNIKATVYGVQ